MKRICGCGIDPDGRASACMAEDGFTLVEMLVSLALIVLLLAMLPNALGLGRRAWEAHEDVGQRLAAVAALGVLEQRLAEAVPAFAAETGGIAFRGDAQELSFVAPARLAGIPGLARWTLRLVAAREAMNPGAGRVQLVAEPYVQTPEAQGEAALVAEFGPQALGLALAYFGRTVEGEPARWHESWPRNDLLPALVAVTLNSGTGDSAPLDGRLVVSLKLAVP